MFYVVASHYLDGILEVFVWTNRCKVCGHDYANWSCFGFESFGYSFSGNILFGNNSYCVCAVDDYKGAYFSVGHFASTIINGFSGSGDDDIVGHYFSDLVAAFHALRM